MKEKCFLFFNGVSLFIVSYQKEKSAQILQTAV